MSGYKPLLSTLQARVAKSSHQRASLPLHYSSAPHHRRFEMSITNGLGGIGFMSMVMGGAITAGCRTGGDGGRITAGSKTVVTNRR